MSMDGQGTKWRRKIAENFNRLSRAHERYRRQTTDRQTDGRATTYSERVREFTFAKNHYSIRARPHNYQLTRKTTLLSECNCMYRMYCIVTYYR